MICIFSSIFWNSPAGSTYIRCLYCHRSSPKPPDVIKFEYFLGNVIVRFARHPVSHFHYASVACSLHYSKYPLTHLLFPFCLSFSCFEWIRCLVESGCSAVLKAKRSNDFRKYVMKRNCVGVPTIAVSPKKWKEKETFEWHVSLRDLEMYLTEIRFWHITEYQMPWNSLAKDLQRTVFTVYRMTGHGSVTGAKTCTIILLS